MASLRQINSRGRNGWQLRFSIDRQRKVIWLPAIDEPAAAIWKLHVEHLVTTHGKSLPSRSTSLWVSSLQPSDQEKLAAVGLIEPISRPVAVESTAPRTLKASSTGISLVET